MIRGTVEGEIDGYKVVINFTEEDLTRMNDNKEYDGILNQFEIGMIPFIVDQVRQHGVKPAWKPKTDFTEKAAAKAANGWECPSHGTTSLRDNQFSKGKKYCSKIQVVDPDEPKPSWAKDNSKEINGEQHWTCRFKES